MSKKLITIILTAVILLSTVSVVHGAKVGDVIGTVYNTDIVAYINNYAIPSYAANGTSVVVAEDLRNFGFDVAWNPNNKTLSITRNSAVYPTEMDVSKTGAPNTKFANLLYTDIKVYANGILIPSYAINGYTMIPLESLTMFGTYNWVSEQRALKLWVNGLNIRSQMQSVSQYSISYVGEWPSTTYPNNYGFYIYEQNGDKISFLIESILGEGRRLGYALVENATITNGVCHFNFHDSFGYKGYGTLTIKNNTLTVSYTVTEEGAGWSITMGEDFTYVKTSNKAIDINPEDYDYSW